MIRGSFLPPPGEELKLIPHSRHSLLGPWTSLCKMRRVKMGREAGVECYERCPVSGPRHAVARDVPSQTDLFLRDSVSPFFSSSVRGLALNPNSSCNKNCKCQTDSFTPVCGADGVTYLSACFAGCNSTVMGSFGWAEGTGEQAARAAASPGARGWVREHRGRTLLFTAPEALPQPVCCCRGVASVRRMRHQPALRAFSLLASSGFLEAAQNN